MILSRILGVNLKKISVLLRSFLYETLDSGLRSALAKSLHYIHLVGKTREKAQWSYSFAASVHGHSASSLVSIVIPVGPLSKLPEEINIVKLFDSILSQRLPIQLIAVAHPSSISRIREELPNASREMPKEKFYLKTCDIKGPAAKRNMGAKEATSPFLVFLDVDDKINLEKLLDATRYVCLKSAMKPTNPVAFPYTIRRGDEVVPVSGESNLHHSSIIFPNNDVVKDLYPERLFGGEDLLITRRLRWLRRVMVVKDSNYGFFEWNDTFRKNRLTARDSTRDDVNLFSASLRDLLELKNYISLSEERNLAKEILSRFIYSMYLGNSGPAELDPVLDAIQSNRAIFFEPVKKLKIRDIEKIQNLALKRVHSPEKNLGPEPHDVLSKLSLAITEPYVQFRGKIDEEPVSSNNLASFSEVSKGTDFLEGLLEFGPLMSTSEFHLGTKKNKTEQDFFRHYLDPLKLYGLREFGTGVASAKFGFKNSNPKRNQYAASNLLRINEYQRLPWYVYESSRLSKKISQLTGENEISRMFVFGTGPTVGDFGEYRLQNNEIGVACNSMVRDKKFLNEQNIKILVAADPIFHAGPSSYANTFRRDLIEWLEQNQEHTFISITRDLHVYKQHLPNRIHNQIFFADIDRDQTLSDVRGTGTVGHSSNILTLLQLPLAKAFQPKELVLVGYSGRIGDDHDRFWEHSSRFQYSELMADIRKVHPAFFAIDHEDYQEEHSKLVEIHLSGLVNQGISVKILGESNVLALAGLPKAILTKSNL